MHRFEAYVSMAKLFWLLLLCIAMVAISAFCTTLPRLNAQLAGWAGVVFFGAGLIVIPFIAFRTSESRVIIDQDGIYTGSSIGLVEWRDISGFRIDSVKGTKFLSVFVVDKRTYLDRMSAMARKSVELHAYMGVSEIVVSFLGLSPGLEEACDFLREKGYDIPDSSSPWA